jgi:hypothetical protein
LSQGKAPYVTPVSNHLCHFVYAAAWQIRHYTYTLNASPTRHAQWKMKGYNKIAALMGRYPESAIVSQFSDLNILNILYLQAEIIGLRKDLRELEDANDRSQEPARASFSRNWYELSSAEEINGSDEQWKLVLLIREKLKEYSMVRNIGLCGRG